MDFYCDKCGAKIDKVEYKPFCFCGIGQCQCQEGGYNLVIPTEDYDISNIKCPECKQYPFKFAPHRVQHLTQVSIREKSVEELIDEIVR